MNLHFNTPGLGEFFCIALCAAVIAVVVFLVLYTAWTYARHRLRFRLWRKALQDQQAAQQQQLEHFADMRRTADYESQERAEIAVDVLKTATHGCPLYHAAEHELLHYLVGQHPAPPEPMTLGNRCA